MQTGGLRYERRGARLKVGAPTGALAVDDSRPCLEFTLQRVRCVEPLRALKTFFKGFSHLPTFTIAPTAADHKQVAFRDGGR